MRAPSRGLAFAYAVTALCFSASAGEPAAAQATAQARPSAKAPQAPKVNPRVQCGCPASRLLARGPQVLDGQGTLSAWLHDGARLEAFAQDEVNKQKLHGVDAPVAIEEFAGFGEHMPVATSSRMVRARATGALAAGTFLGVLRASDVAPRDVVAISGPGSPQAPPPGAAPALKALWLAPLEERERPGCGAWLTHRVAFELVDGTATAPTAPSAPEAFLVTDQRTGSVALVDARFAGVFGFGRVEVCEQGIAFAPGEATRIEVRPVSSSFGIGAPWSFSSDGTGTTDPTRASSPPSADAARILEPFPVPGQETAAGPSYKEVAIFVMGGGVTLAIVFALVTWVIIPARRRRMQDFPCPTCGQKIPVDTLDPKTDGFFCPGCGASGFWKGKGPVVDVKSLPSASAKPPLP